MRPSQPEERTQPRYSRARAVQGGFARPDFVGLRAHWRDHAHRFWQGFGALLAREAEHRTPFLWLPVAFGLGILVYFSAAQEPSLFAGPALALIALVPVVLDTGWARKLGLALLFAALGFSASTFRTWSVATPMLERTMIAQVKGFVETVETGNGRLRLTLRPVSMEGVPPAALPAVLRIGAPGASLVTPGDFITLRARLSPPAEAAMPMGYDFRLNSFFKSIGGVGYSLGKPHLETAPSQPPWDLSFNAAIDRARNALTKRIAQAIGGQAGALSAALITGKRGLISNATNDDLRAAGIYHIVSISGIHMVLAAGVLFWSIRALLGAIPGMALGWPIKKIAAGFAMVGAIFYCVFSGSEVATERSLIMTMVMLGAILADRPALAMRNLAISALIVLAREPESLLGPSFQMSFAAVACLIGANRVWRDWRTNHLPFDHGPVLRALRTIALAFLGIGATTLIATLATGPFSVFHFHRVNPYGLIGNALSLPLVSLIVMPCAVIGTLLAPLNLDGIVWRIMGEGVSGVLYVAERVAQIENASYAIRQFTLPAFSLMVLSLLIFTGFQTRLRALFLVPIALLFFIGIYLPAPALIADPSGTTALVRAHDGVYRLLAPQRANAFTLAQWLPALGDSRMPDDPSLRSGVRCDRLGCALGEGRQSVAVSLTPEALRVDCERAGFVISPLEAPPGCEASTVFDAAHFSAYGASMVTLDTAGDMRVIGTLDPEIRRPWRKPPQPGKDAGLPNERWNRAPAAATRTDGRRFFGLLPPARGDRVKRASEITPDDPLDALSPEHTETTQMPQ